MRCNSCGEINAPSATTCKNCGAVLNKNGDEEQVRRTVVQSISKCPKCGYLVAYAFSDAKGHFKIRCKKCKEVSVLNFAYFCRRKRRKYQVSKS